MIFISRLTRNYLIALAGIALAIELIFPSQVQAECGDYVIVGRPLTVRDGTFWQLAWMNGPDAISKHRPMDLPGPSRSCVGPNCHQRNSVPLPPVFHGTSVNDLFVCLTARFAADVPFGQQSWPAFDPAVMDGHRPRIEHPPRDS